MNYEPTLETPLLTLSIAEALNAAMRQEERSLSCSLDLMRSKATVDLTPSEWRWKDRSFPYLTKCKERTIYYWTGEIFAPISRYTDALIKLVPTEWGAPTFEIDGIKMLPTAKLSPYEDARVKVAMVEPQGKSILDTCGGLGYFAAWCLQSGAARIASFEKNPDVLWVRSLNPWSPKPGGALSLTQGDIAKEITALTDQSFDAILHDPPRFGIAGELYSQIFYDQLARVLKRGGRLFHYTGSPNKLTSGREVPAEVSNRLRRAGFSTTLRGDGVLAVKQSAHRAG